MHSVETPTVAVVEPRPSNTEPVPTRSRFRSRLIAAVAIAAVGVGAWIFQDQIRAAWTSATARPHPAASEGAEDRTAAARNRRQPVARLVGGIIVLPESAQTAMGLATVPVRVQTEPIRLELPGTTDYISDTVTEVRPMFKGRVDKVHVDVGQAVQVGAPLVDLYSKDLAEAKSSYKVERIQWLHDRNLLDTREKLFKSKSISEFLFEDTRNNEMKSHKEYEVARDKLLVYGLTDAEVEHVEAESGSQNARMTLRSPSDGFVIARKVARGNLYDENDTLLTIAPLERLWVWGQVFESDLDLVQMGQSWEIGFPYLKDKVRGKVEYISNRVDPNTHAVRVRTSIPNKDGRLKSDMLVQGTLAIDPVPGRTVVPRTALVVDNGQSFVFVRVPGHGDRFEHRLVDVAQEKDDHAVVAHGLKAGEDVVSVGGLLLAQAYDDLRLIANGAPATPLGEGAD